MRCQKVVIILTAINILSNIALYVFNKYLIGHDHTVAVYSKLVYMPGFPIP